MYSDTRRRKNSLRQPGHNYHRPGTVFVTIDTWCRQELFGSIVDGNLQPTPGGAMVIQRWGEIPHQFPNATLDAFVLMPDHLHGIVTTTADGHPQPSIGKIVRWFKAATHASWRVGVRRHGWPPQDG